MATYLIFFFSSAFSYSQELRENTLLKRDIEIYLLWDKAFDLIEQERYDKLNELMQHVKKQENS